MFAKTTLASAVAAALGVSAVGVAQANTSVFFPYVALSETVTTIVSVINKSGENYFADGRAIPGQDGKHLHYRLFFKPANSNTARCDEFNEYLPTSQNDIQTIDLGGVFGTDTLGVLFNDPSVRNNWVAENKSFALGEIPRSIEPTVGYLYVDNNHPPGVRDTLAGEAIVLEFGSGAAWGYKAFSSPVYGDFTWAAAASPQDIAVLPNDLPDRPGFKTRLLVTPVSANQAPDGGNNYTATVEIITNGNQGNVFDRDENLISGTKSQSVTCVGRLDFYQELLSTATANRVKDGGWAGVVNYRGSAGAPQISTRFPWAVRAGDVAAAGPMQSLASAQATSDIPTPDQPFADTLSDAQWACSYTDENNETNVEYDTALVGRNGNQVYCASAGAVKGVAVQVKLTDILRQPRGRANLAGGATVIKLEYNPTPAFGGEGEAKGTINNGMMLQTLGIAPIN